MTDRDSCILAIDLGTGGAKIAVFNRELKRLGGASAAYPTFYPRPGYAEQNPSDWMDAIKESLSAAVKASRINPKSIAAIGICGMSPVVVPVDYDGTAIARAILWLDSRTAKSPATHGIHASSFGAKVHWLYSNEPEISHSAATFHHATGYLLQQLTGEIALDRTQCGLSGLSNDTRDDWCLDTVRRLGIAVETLPKISASHEVIGTVRPIAAQRFGLREGIPVIAGAMDNAAAALGVGVVAPADCFLSVGTATNVGISVAPRSSIGPFHAYPHIVPDQWLLVGGVDFGGATLKWFKELLQNSSYSDLDRLVQQDEALGRTPIFLPYMTAQRAPMWDPYTQGVFFGLQPSTDRAAIVRSIMEGTAMGVRSILHELRFLGHSINAMRLTGSAAESPSYCSVLANVTGCPLSVVSDCDVSVAGIALATAVGIGWIPSFTEIGNFIASKIHVEPDVRLANYYNDQYSIFCALRHSLKPLFAEYTDFQNKYS